MRPSSRGGDCPAVSDDLDANPIQTAGPIVVSRGTTTGPGMHGRLLAGFECLHHRIHVPVEREVKIAITVVEMAMLVPMSVTIAVVAMIVRPIILRVGFNAC